MATMNVGTMMLTTISACSNVLWGKSVRSTNHAIGNPKKSATTTVTLANQAVLISAV